MFQLSETEQQTLLEIARGSVHGYLSGQPYQPKDIPAGILIEPHGIFVSIHKHKRLRGCIGNISPDGPLHQHAANCAIAAAISDSRFPPLAEAELDEIEFEISVLSPIERIENVGMVEVGLHGLMIVKGKSRGLLLPQVAVQYGWTVERFLAETCIKAGLKPDEWKRDADIHVFSAFVFGERRSSSATYS